jgi:hypothetical protein
MHMVNIAEVYIGVDKKVYRFDGVCTRGQMKKCNIKAPTWALKLYSRSSSVRMDYNLTQSNER